MQVIRPHLRSLMCFYRLYAKGSTDEAKQWAWHVNRCEQCPRLEGCHYWWKNTIYRNVAYRWFWCGAPNIILTFESLNIRQLQLYDFCLNFRFQVSFFSRRKDSISSIVAKTNVSFLRKLEKFHNSWSILLISYFPRIFYLHFEVSCHFFL